MYPSNATVVETKVDFKTSCVFRTPCRGQPCAIQLQLGHGTVDNALKKNWVCRVCCLNLQDSISRCMVLKSIFWWCLTRCLKELVVIMHFRPFRFQCLCGGSLPLKTDSRMWVFPNRSRPPRPQEPRRNQVVEPTSKAPEKQPAHQNNPQPQPSKPEAFCKLLEMFGRVPLWGGKCSLPGRGLGPKQGNPRR